MPSWLKDAYKGDVAFRDDLLSEGKDIATEMGEDPRQILGMDPKEQEALKVGQGGFDEAGRLAGAGEKAIAGLGDIEGDYLDPAKGFVQGSSKLGNEAYGQVGGAQASTGKAQGLLDATAGMSGQAKDFITDTGLSDQAAGFAGDTGLSDEAAKAAGFDMDALRQKYTSGYTDDVVNTTLAGMTRAADRERLGREGRAAAVGGTTNTRAAVADAVAQQLTGMNMAEQEAKLRDQGFRTAIEGAQGEAGLELDRGKLYDTLAQTGMDRASILDTLAKTGMDRGMNLDKLVGRELEKVESQRGLTADELKTGEFLRGLSSDELDRSGAMLDIGKLGLDTGETMASLYDKYASGASARGLGEAGLLASYGETNRGLNQAQIDEDYNAKKNAHGWLADLFSGTQYNKGPTGGVTTSKGTTTAQTPTPSPFSQIAGTAAQAAGAYLATASDERVKDDITPVGDALAALREVTPSDYHYKPGFGHVEGPTRGLVAQHLTHIPGAVIRDEGQPLHVDPYPVLATVVRAVQQLDLQMNPRGPQTGAGLAEAA